MNVLEIISSLGPLQNCPRLPVSMKGFGMPFYLCTDWKADVLCSLLAYWQWIVCPVDFQVAHYKVPPYGRWGGWCVWARPPLLAHHIQGGKVWGPGHTDTWPCPGTEQRHAALWSRKGAQTTLLRWGWWHFKRENGTLAVCDKRTVKLKHATIIWDLLWEMGNSVAALISPLAPDSPDHSRFYGLYGVYPAALLFKRRQPGIVTEGTWQECSPV